MNVLHQILDTILRPWRYVDQRTPEPIKETGILALGLLCATLITFVGLYSDHQWYNVYTAYLLVTTLAFCLVIMTYGTPFWTFRTVGVLFLVIGDMLIYGPLVTAVKGWYIFDEVLRLSLARGFFVTGSVFVLYGLSRWVYDYKRRKRSMESTPSVLMRGDMLE